MSNASPQPTHREQWKVLWENRAAQLKQQLTESRKQTAISQAENMNFLQIAQEESQRGEQPPSDRAGPPQVKTTAVAQAESNAALSHQLPDDRGTLKETPQLTAPSMSNAAEHPMLHGSALSSAASTGRVMEMPPPPTRSRIAGKNMSDTPMMGNEVQCHSSASSSSNGRVAIKVPEKTEAGARSKVQQVDDSTPKKDQPASRNTTKSMAIPQDESNAKSSPEDGEITTKPSAAPDKKSPQGPVHQHASSKKTLPTRISTGTSIVPIKTRAERSVSGPLEATPASKHRGAQADTGPARLSATRSEGGNRHRRASSPVRARRTDRDAHITWESYKAPPLDHHAYPGASREPRHRSASPVGRTLIDVQNKEVERLASRYPDLHVWLQETGWNNPDYRMRQLDRIHRMAEIKRAKSQLEMEFDRDKARLKESGEHASKLMYLSNADLRPMPLPRAVTRQPADVERPKEGKLGPYSVADGLKRKRSEESEDDRDGDLSPKYYRTSRNHRRSRAGHHGSRALHERGREEPRHRQDRERQRGGRSPPPRNFPERLPSWTLPQRNSRAPYGFPSPLGHTLPHNGVEAERAAYRSAARARLPRRHASPRFSSSPPNVRMYFQEA